MAFSLVLLIGYKEASRSLHVRRVVRALLQKGTIRWKGRGILTSAHQSLRMMGLEGCRCQGDVSGTTDIRIVSRDVLCAWKPSLRCVQMVGTGRF